jgi:transcription-repair coupling factor (superfamily II helicase)
MDVGGASSEFIKLSYKDGDRLFIPIYRIGQIHKYSGPSSTHQLDKLGGHQWKNVKTKVGKRLKDIAAELLALYAKRSQLTRPAFPHKDDDYVAFENSFAFEETIDQENAIDSVMSDMESEHPMDRLVCGDVGFGKTEVAMRSAFKAVQGKKQVAILAPTTVLSFQHFENFKKRFKGWPINIQALNRFLSRQQVKEVIQGLKDGTVDVVIGTHRLLSKDVEFQNLGLLIIDEEQKFGVTHKEKIRKMKTSIDTLAMSATPIPRTLNMSLMNIRDLSLINTAPIDRLPTRTFVCKPSEETIRKAVYAEIERGGQVFFIHNRVQSIHGVADELRQMLPNVRIRVAHGQMDEHELEKVMLAFLHHEIDLLICTTIIESGIDIPRANTMFIDKANTFGLSQLYQLRGRVGRSKTRAYCYLLLPKSGNIDPQAQERLKIIQENTALGSGIRIAQYDLELRGSGNILGEDQSGHINAVGYEMYTELLDEAIRTAKGEAIEEKVDPEINVKIPAFIPDNYIKDIRTRLSYYKVLSQISSHDEIDQVEDELRDQFGKLPEPAVNLIGLMLIRLMCKKLGIRVHRSYPFAAGASDQTHYLAE